MSVSADTEIGPLNDPWFRATEIFNTPKCCISAVCSAFSVRPWVSPGEWTSIGLWFAPCRRDPASCASPCEGCQPTHCSALPACRCPLRWMCQCAQYPHWTVQIAKNEAKKEIVTLFKGKIENKHKICTVKAVNYDHWREWEKVVLILRWSLLGLHYMGQKLCVLNFQVVCFVSWSQGQVSL